MKYSTICLILLETTRQTGNLEEYFIKNTNHLYLYIFPTSFIEKRAFLVYYENGEKKYEHFFFWYKGKQKLLKIIFYYLYYSYIAFFILPKKTITITYQPLFCIFSGIYRLLKRIETVFCVGDYFAVRKDIITNVYHYLTLHYTRELPYVLFPSYKFKEIYLPRRKNLTQHRSMLLYGIKKIQIKNDREKNLLGYIGQLRPGQGVELLFQVLKNNPKLHLDIIGSGILLEKLKQKATEMQINEYVTFYGFLDENSMEDIVKRWEIAVAPYDPNPENMTFYAEPSKVKLYLQYHLPVIMTSITYMSDEIKKYKGGVVVTYDVSSILRAIETIQKSYSSYKKGVEQLIDKYEYNTYYDKHFKFLSTLFA